MATADEKLGVDRAAIYRDVIGILSDIVADWDVGEISADTSLGNIVLESISLVYLIGDLQQHYNLQDQLLQKLRESGTKVTDLRVGDIVDFVCEILSHPRRKAAGGES
jgi:acyl carrier protein